MSLKAKEFKSSCGFWRAFENDEVKLGEVVTIHRKGRCKTIMLTMKKNGVDGPFLVGAN